MTLPAFYLFIVRDAWFVVRVLAVAVTTAAAVVVVVVVVAHVVE